MIVDDEEYIRSLVKKVLFRHDYEVIEASSGEELISLIKEHKDEIYVILLDIVMPKFNGFDLLEILKKNQDTKDIRVIMLTSVSRVEDRVRALTNGASDYILKQFEPEELIARVKIQVEIKHAEEKLKLKTEELLSLGNEIQELNRHLEQKVLERTSEIKKLLKHKDEFISQLGHDIKTPLTPLTSLLPLIEKREVDPKSRELLKVCIRNVGYIKNLVVSTLQLARLNSLDAILDIKDVNLLDLVNSAILDNSNALEDSNIKIENKIGEQLIVLADEIRLRELFNNLISNAIKFTDAGGKLTIDAVETGDGFTEISIKDTGIGLEDEVKANLFKEFYKADQSRHELASSGLGLSICKRIVEKHGGKIWAKSPGKNKGTTFYFTIPQKKKVALLSVTNG